MPVRKRMDCLGSRLAIALLGFVLVLVGCKSETQKAPQAPLPNVSRVTIKSTYIGYRTSDYANTMVDLRRDGRRFVGFRQASRWDGSVISKREWNVSAEAVDALQKALVSPPASAPSLRELKLNPFALQLFIDSYVERYLKNAPPESHRAIRRYRNTLLRRQAQESLLAEGLRIKWFSHDYPEIEVRIHLSDGTVLEASSDSWMAAMTPWKVGETINFSPKISTAVAALLPENGTNRDRLMEYALNGVHLEAVVMNAMDTALDGIVFDRLYPGGFKVLRQLFRSPEIDMDWFGCPDGGKCPRAKLELPGSPENLRLLANLEGENGVLRKADLESYHAMLSQVSRSALMPVIRKDPDSYFLIQANRSIVWSNPAVRQQFVQDMRSIAGFPIEALTAEMLEKAVLVESPYSSFWVVLPDGSVVWWMTMVDKIVGRLCFQPPQDGESIGSNEAYQCVGEILPANKVQ